MAAGASVNPRALNSAQRQAVLSSSVEMIQPIYSGTITPTSQNIINITPRNVGLVKRFIVEVTATLTNAAAGVATLTDTAISNLLSQVVFTDLNNNVRINTTGLHLSLLASAKRRNIFLGTADYNKASSNNVSQMLNVNPAAWGVYTAPATIAVSTAGTVRGVFEVPLAYTDDDLRGAVYANVLNATMNLQLTLNVNAFAGSNDYTNAVYSGGAGGTFTSAQINVYQVYLDQLPIDLSGSLSGTKGSVVLPILDLSTTYELKNTNFAAMTVGQDFPISYSNFRDYLSVFAIYNNSGGATGRTFGTDINYWALQTANTTYIKKLYPLTATQFAREIFGSDLPAGIYYFSSRRQPISTTQFGNEQLILNASVAGSSAYCNIYWEDMAIQNTLTQGASLAAN